MKRKMKLCKGEKFLYSLAIFCFIFWMSFNVVASALISSYNVQVESLGRQVTNHERRNESLVMRVNEITAFDEIKDVVSEMGLAYNNENIIVIND